MGIIPGVIMHEKNPRKIQKKSPHIIAIFMYVMYHIFFSHSTRLLAATTLRNVLGTKNLAEILSERETISHVMQSSLDDATDPW